MWAQTVKFVKKFTVNSAYFSAVFMSEMLGYVSIIDCSVSTTEQRLKVYVFRYTVIYQTE